MNWEYWKPMYAANYGFFPLFLFDNNVPNVQNLYHTQPISQVKIQHLPQILEKAQDVPQQDIKHQKREPQPIQMQQFSQNDKIEKKKPHRIQSKTKNTETNLIKQILSYLISKSKSFADLKVILGDDVKIKAFYSSMESLKTTKPKYLSRKFLLDIAFLKKETIQERILRRNKLRLQKLGLEQLQKIILKLIFLFLKKHAPSSILSSTRINQNTILHHLRRRRDLIEYFKAQVNVVKAMQ